MTNRVPLCSGIAPVSLPPMREIMAGAAPMAHTGTNVPVCSIPCRNRSPFQCAPSAPYQPASAIKPLMADAHSRRGNRGGDAERKHTAAAKQGGGILGAFAEIRCQHINKLRIRWRLRQRATRDLIQHDKTYQIMENGLRLDEEKLPKGILRFEIHELRERVSKIEKKLGTTDIESLLSYYIEESEKYITRCFGRAFPDERFMQLDTLNELIQKVSDAGLREGMIRLVMLMTRTKSLEKGEAKLCREGYDVEAVLAKFRERGVSPIPLRKKFCAKTMPGPSVLLQRITHRNVLVW